MKPRYRLFLRRGSVYYAFDNQTKLFESLKTKDRHVALRLLHAKNEACHQPLISLEIARAYLIASDPAAKTRTWRHVMDEIIRMRKGETQARWRRAALDSAFDIIRDRPLIETRVEQFNSVLLGGTVSTNVYCGGFTITHSTSVGFRDRFFREVNGRRSTTANIVRLSWKSI